jgi:hypothetical protein
MHTLLLAAFLALPLTVPAQTAPVSATDAALRQALTAQWVGVLEYRDYAEPAGSTKRVDLPTWLTITSSGGSMTWRYTYDDGPNKVVEETDAVTFDATARSYAEAVNGKPESIFTVTGYEGLKEGRGMLVLHGVGTDNDKPAETRVTMTIRRNLLQMVEEVRPAGSSDGFAFRHMYRFTRAQRPVVTGAGH